MREKGQLFLAGAFQLIHVKGMRGSTNNTQHSNNSGGQDPLMDAKSREQKCEGKQDMHIVSNYLLQDIY